MGEPQFGVLQLPQELKEQVCKPLKTHAGTRIPRVGISEIAITSSCSRHPLQGYIALVEFQFGGK